MTADFETKPLIWQEKGENREFPHKCARSGLLGGSPPTQPPAGERTIRGIANSAGWAA